MAEPGASREAHEHYLYEDRILWTDKRRGVVSAGGLSPIVVAPPPEFSGEEGVWNPEQLLLAAANACLMTTFMAIAQKARLRVVSYASGGAAHLTKAPDGKYAITSIELFPRIEFGEGESVERALKVLLKAEGRCLISNSLKYRTSVTPEVRVVASSSVVPAAAAP